MPARMTMTMAVKIIAPRTNPLIGPHVLAIVHRLMAAGRVNGHGVPLHCLDRAVPHYPMAPDASSAGCSLWNCVARCLRRAGLLGPGAPHGNRFHIRRIAVPQDPLPLG